MSHSLIVGCTMSGKTTLAVLLCRALKNRGMKCAVLDPLKDQRWGDVDFITDNPQEFLAYLKDSKNLSHFVFVDEASTTIGKYNAEMDWLVTTGRHYGHSCTLICHRLTQLSVTARNQCTTLYIFDTAQSDFDFLADEYRKPDLRTCPELSRGQFYLLKKNHKTRLFAVDFAKQAIYPVRITVDNDKSVSTATALTHRRKNGRRSRSHKKT